MNATFAYVPEPAWPPLAWLAKCREGQSKVRVHHGSRLETRDNWFCEAVWDADFDAGEFDRTDLVFGTGGRIRSGAPLFISSGATCDRLQFCRRGNAVLVSNSLACLKAFSTCWPDPGFPDYRQFFYSIEEGIHRYQRVVPKNGATLVYYHDLYWDGNEIGFRDKPVLERRFDSFDTYAALVNEALRRIGANLASTSRRVALTPMGTISSGYDSGAATALARAAGLRKAFTFTTARGEEPDDGLAMADYLGIEIEALDRMAWRSSPMIEVPFIAADAEGGELQFAAAERQLQSAVLFTGNHGDKVWSKAAEYGLSPDIRGGGCSGLSLTEYRLQTGSIHVPVPYIGVRNIRDIVAISNSLDMAPWDIAGDYSRPICRRILEDAGVPRQLFGMKKKASASLIRNGDICLSRAARSDFHRWCRNHATELAASATERSLGTPLAARWPIPEVWFQVEASLRRLLQLLPSRIHSALAYRLLAKRYSFYKKVNRFEPWLFPWALERLADRYRSSSDDLAGH